MWDDPYEFAQPRFHFIVAYRNLVLISAKSETERRSCRLEACPRRRRSLDECRASPRVATRASPSLVKHSRTYARSDRTRGEDSPRSGIPCARARPRFSALACATHTTKTPPRDLGRRRQRRWRWDPPPLPRPRYPSSEGIHTALTERRETGGERRVAVTYRKPLSAAAAGLLSSSTAVASAGGTELPRVRYHSQRYLNSPARKRVNSARDDIPYGSYSRFAFPRVMTDSLSLSSGIVKKRKRVKRNIIYAREEDTLPFRSETAFAFRH